MKVVLPVTKMELLNWIRICVKLMKRNFAICLVRGTYGDTYAIFNKEDYGTCWSKCKIIFESDNYTEICNEYKRITKK